MNDEELNDAIYELGVLLADPTVGLIVTTMKQNFWEKFKDFELLEAWECFVDRFNGFLWNLCTYYHGHLLLSSGHLRIFCRFAILDQPGQIGQEEHQGNDRRHHDYPEGKVRRQDIQHRGGGLR